RVEDKNQALPYIQEGLVEFMEPNYYVYLDEGTPTSEPTPQVMPQETAVPDTAVPLEAPAPPAPFVPNDYDKTNQWAAENIGLSYAWEHNLTGAGVRVAVIDSGVSPHEDFPLGALQPGHNYAYDDLRNEENGTIKPKRTADDATDFYWHGTFVAGIIAAATNNGKGIVGMAPGVQIVPLRVFYKSTLSGKVTSTAEYVANAIADAATVYDCDVLNLSLGLSSNSEFVRDAVTRATAAGAIVVASVGNDSNSTKYYPAGYHGVVGVGSIGSDGKVSSFSQKNDSVSVVAPGGSVYSLYCPSGKGTNGYNTSSGTSFSAPHVAGMAAL
ncbi:MAG: S8 family serine peptidase, partial [Oscillospiraceae bacterium]